MKTLRKTHDAPLEEAAYEQFFSLSPDLFCIADLEGYFKRVNPAFCALLGYTEEDLLSESFLNLVHPDDRQVTLQVLAEQREGISTVFFENRYRKKSGQWCWLTWTARVDSQRRLAFAVARESTKRKAYEQALGVSHKDIATILDSITDAFFAVDRDWKITYWNRQAELVVGRECREVLGRNLWDCFPEEVGLGFYTRYQEAILTQTSARFESYLQRTGRWLEVSAFPSREGLSVYFRDIDERKRKEQALERMNERYRLLTKATGGVVWDWDLSKGRTYYYEDNFRSVFGYDVVNDYLPYEYWVSELLHPDDRPRIFDEIEQIIAERKDFWASEYRLKKADGTYAYVQARGFVLKDESGNVLNMIGFTEDISAHKEAEHVLQEREESYRQLFNNAPLPQVICDAKTFRFLKVNEAALRHYGYSKDEFLSLHFPDLYEAGEREKLEQYTQLVRSKSHSVQAEGVHRKKHGQAIKVELSAVAITYRQRAALLVTIHDVTEKRKLQERLVRLRLLEQKKIMQAQMKGQEQERLTIGRELHDNINQQLTAAKLILDLARTSEDMRKELIGRCENMLQNAINEIRALSKSLVFPALYDAGLAEAVKELLATYEMTQPFALQFIYACPDHHLSQDISIMLFRIIQEQLVNISRYAEATQVTISVEQSGTVVSLRIADNGKGFDLKKKSMGIGISNIRNRVELCNGSMAIHTAEGRGCEMLIQVPLDVAAS